MKKSENLVRSIRYALQGYKHAFISQRNVKIHLLITVAVVFFSFLFDISGFEWCVVIICIGIVWISELLNSSIEFIFDLIQPGYDERVKFGKNIAAAAVLTASIVSLIVGLIIFLPKILALLL